MAEFETITIPNLPDLTLAITSFIESSNADGKSGKATLQQLANFISPFVTAIGGSGYLPTTSTVLPAASAGKFTVVGAGTYSQTTGGSITTTATFTFLASSATTWSIATAISVPNNIQTLADLTAVVTVTGALVANSYFSATGVPTSRAGVSRTALIPIKATDDIWVNTASTLPALYSCFFDSSSVFISNFLPTGGVLTKIPVPSNAAFVGVSGDTANVIVVEKHYLSYANLVSAFNTSVYNKVITDKVVADGWVSIEKATTLINGYYDSNGVYTADSRFTATPKIAIAPDEIIYLTVPNEGVAARSVVFWDISNNLISAYAQAYNNEIVAIPPNAAFIAIGKFTSTVTLSVLSYGKRKYKLDNLQDIITNTGQSDAKRNLFFDLGDSYRFRKTTTPVNNFGVMMIGQSNMAEMIPYAQIASNGIATTSTRVNLWNGTTYNHYDLPANVNWGIWWTILLQLDAYLTKPIQYYRFAVGGTSLAVDWNPETNSLTALANQAATQFLNIKDFTTTVTNFKAVIWIQGESDDTGDRPASYYQNLKDFIAFVRGVIGNPIIPFVIVGMHKNQTHYNQTVRDAQVKVASEDSHDIFINPDSLTYTTIDGTHYDGAYCLRLSPLIANAIKDL